MLVLAAALVCAVAAPATGQDQRLLFDSCNILYQAGDYEQAAACYDSLVDDGVHNGPLHFNLGNASLHLQRHGDAIYHYRQAQVFMPRNSELRSNLGKARQAAGVTDRAVPRSPVSQAVFFYDSLSPGELLWITAALHVLLWLTLCVRLFRSGEILTWSAIAVAATFAVFATTTTLRVIELATRPTAVVVSGTAVARSAQDRTAPQMFTLPEGSEVRVVARQGSWAAVEAMGGSRGWVDMASLGVIEYGWERHVGEQHDRAGIPAAGMTQPAVGGEQAPAVGGS
jgi:hypothetical protein